MSCLQRLEALEANKRAQNNVQQNHQQLQSQVLMAQCDGKHSVTRGAHRISYVYLRKDALYQF